MKLSPSSDCGAKPMACSTPSTRPQWSATASRTASACAASVTSSSNTGISSPPGSLRAVRLVRLSPRPAPVSTRSAPSWRATRATAYASDASVSTPVTTMFLPSRRPIVCDRSPSGRVCKARRHAHRHPRRHRARLVAVSPPASRASATRRSSARARSTGRWRPGTRSSSAGPTSASVLQYGDNPTAADGRPRGDRHAVGLGGDDGAGARDGDEGQDRRVDGQRPRPRRWRVPAARAAARLGGRPRPGRRARRATSSPPSTTCRPRSSATSVSRSTPTC